MRIGLLSDTHIPDVAKVLPHSLTEAFSGVDLILHAGDIFTVPVLDELERMAPVLAAMGDEEREDILIDRRVKFQHTLELEGLRLQLIHISLLYSISIIRERWHSKAESDTGAPDIVVFGHDHHPVVKNLGGTLFVNPGSPTYLRYHPGLGTVAILDIVSGKAYSMKTIS
jgi:putative phosphoesterase